MLRATNIIVKQGLLQLDNVSLGPEVYITTLHKHQRPSTNVTLKIHDNVTGIVVKGAGVLRSVYENSGCSF